MEKKLYFTPTVEKITVEASELLGNSNGCAHAAKRCNDSVGESCGSGDSSVTLLQSTYEDVEPATTNWSIWDEEL